MAAARKSGLGRGLDALLAEQGLIEEVQGLLEQGYAVLYCNKRGLGESTGNWKKNSFQGRADDAYAAVSYLKSLPFIDGNRIGISGHSQGGWIAFLDVCSGLMN